MIFERFVATKVSLWRRLAVLPLLALAACARGPSPELLATRDSLSAARERLHADRDERVMVLGRVMAELAAIPRPDTLPLTLRGAPPRTPSDSVLARVIEVANGYSELQGELQGLRGRLGASSRRVDSLRTAMQAAVATRDSTIRLRDERVTALTSEVSNLQGTQSRLQQHAEALADTVRSLILEANRVYYAIGTKEELIRQGVIQAEPGPRFLYFLWHQGESLLPARTLDPARFQSADRREWTSVPIPDPSLRYRLVSRQDLSATGTASNQKGWITGSEIRIQDPPRFWRGSRFLILVRDR